MNRIKNETYEEINDDRIIDKDNVYKKPVKECGSLISLLQEIVKVFFCYENNDGFEYAKQIYRNWLVNQLLNMNNFITTVKFAWRVYKVNNQALMENVNNF